MSIRLALKSRKEHIWQSYIHKLSRWFRAVFNDNIELQPADSGSLSARLLWVACEDEGMLQFIFWPATRIHEKHTHSLTHSTSPPDIPVSLTFCLMCLPPIIVIWSLSRASITSAPHYARAHLWSRYSSCGRFKLCACVFDLEPIFRELILDVLLLIHWLNSLPFVVNCHLPLTDTHTHQINIGFARAPLEGSALLIIICSIRYVLLYFCKSSLNT